MKSTLNVQFESNVGMPSSVVETPLEAASQKSLYRISTREGRNECGGTYADPVSSTTLYETGGVPTATEPKKSESAPWLVRLFSQFSRR